METKNKPKQKWIPNPNYATATHEVDPKLPVYDQIETTNGISVIAIMKDNSVTFPYSMGNTTTQTSKTELPPPDSMSTNADKSEMTTSNDNEVARLREVCEWAADMMDGISPARGQEIRDAIQKPHNQ